jgi:hypothetical protein
MGTPRSSNGSVRAEPSRKSADAEKAVGTIITLPVSDQPYVNREWFLLLLHLVRGCVRNRKRVPHGTYGRLLLALDQFAKNERPGGQYVEADRQLAFWILDRQLGQRHRDLPYHPVLERDFDPVQDTNGESPEKNERGRSG